MKYLIPIVFICSIARGSLMKEPVAFSQRCNLVEEHGDRCIQKLVRVHNPVNKTVEVGLDCGPENNRYLVIVPARTKLSFLVSLDEPIPVNVLCTVWYWKDVL